MQPRKFCIEGCGRETGAYSHMGRENPLWCPECDERRIHRITQSLEDIQKGMQRQRELDSSLLKEVSNAKD